ncbi:MAG: energy transducer TonB [Smithella sp.]
MKEQLFERFDASGMESFSTTAAMSVTGHVVVLFLVFMASSFPLSVKKNLDQLPIIQATLVTEKGMPSVPQQTVVTVQRKAEADKQKEVVKPRVIPKTSEQKTAPVPFPMATSQAAEKASGTSSAMSIDAKSIGMAANTDTVRASNSGGSGGTSAVPRYRSNPRPPYPFQARTRGHEGLVVLTAEVREDGRVSTIRLKRSSGYASLDQSALATVRSWLFEPARRLGMVVASVVEIPVRFSLQDERDD